MTDITTPSFGESISDALIARWNKRPGDPVRRDEVLVELETDKIVLEVCATEDGTLATVSAAEGATVTPGTVLGTVTPAAASDSAAHAPPTPAATPAPAPGTRTPSPAGSPPARAAHTPAAATTARASASAAILTPAKLPRPHPRETRVPMTRVRLAIARRLKESQNTAAMLTTFNEVDMSAVIALRDQYRDGFVKRHGVKLGFMGFFVRACIAALKAVPEVNSEIDGTDLIYKTHYDIGVAVGTERGLVVPVVRDADAMDLARIEKSIADLGAKARAGKLALRDLEGGTFSISNGGIYGSLMSTPILNAPQSGILGMHAIQQRPVNVGGQIALRPMMYIALSYDHRIVDGKQAVTFLVKVKEQIEEPNRLLLEL